MLRRLCVPLFLAILLMAALVQGAAAEPSHPANNWFPFTIDCEGQLVDVLVTGGGGPKNEPIVPAKVVGSTSVFNIRAFDEIVEITPPRGPTETFRLNESKGHLRGDEVTCQIDDTKTFPEGVFHVVGTVTGFFTPRKP
jgi:hypothetical protein